jgi:hypothetical protein
MEAWRRGGRGGGVDAAGDGAVTAWVEWGRGRRCGRRRGNNGNRKVTDRRAVVVLAAKEVPLFSPIRSF